MDSILIYKDGQEHGPYSLEDVRRLLAEGNVSEDDYARQSQATEWSTVAAQLLDSQITEQAETVPNTSTEAAPLPKGCGCLGLCVIVFFVLATIGWWLTPSYEGDYTEDQPYHEVEPATLTVSYNLVTLTQREASGLTITYFGA